jgi:hypothetical protein
MQSAICGPFPETHRTKEGGKLGRLNGVQRVPWDGGGLAQRISTDKRMAQQYQRRRMGKTILESERRAVMFQGIESKRNVCGLRHFIEGHKDRWQAMTGGREK